MNEEKNRSNRTEPSTEPYRISLCTIHNLLNNLRHSIENKDAYQLPKANLMCNNEIQYTRNTHTFPSRFGCFIVKNLEKS